ncbi:CAX5 [Symbiodinium sp. KB8]|nr:CAX5 [Symbiodinium sp. KB8]
MAMKMRHRLHNVEFKRPTSVPESLAVAAVESEPQPVPLAKILGDATEELAGSINNDTITGLLNATFGNAVEMIVAIQSIRSNLLDIVKASLLGSVLSNTLLVLGTAFLLGGLTRSRKRRGRYHSFHVVSEDFEKNGPTRMEKEQKFAVKSALISMAMLMFSCMSFALPTIFNSYPSDDRKSVLQVSRIGAVIVLSSYVAYLIFQLLTHEKTLGGEEEALSPGLEEGEDEEEDDEDDAGPGLSASCATGLMAVSTLAVAVNSEFLVDVIESVVRSNGLPESFIGVVLLPIAGNACEHASAIRFAMQVPEHPAVSGKCLRAMAITVTVCILSGGRASVSLPRHALISALRRAAQSALGRGIRALVTSTGEVLQAFRSLAEEGIEDGDVVSAIVREVEVFAHKLGRSFAAIGTDGRVTTWGHGSNGGDSLSVKEKLQDVQDVKATVGAFAAICGDGKVVTWGNPDCGGDSTAVEAMLEDVCSVQATYKAFAALRRDGSVIAWGSGAYGGDTEDINFQLQDVRCVYSTTGAFAAVKHDGTVITWGSLSCGGNSDTVRELLTDVTEIVGASRAFAAIKADGTVATWCRKLWPDFDAIVGGDSEAVQHQLTDVQQVIASTHAFAAIRSAGDVVTWGASSCGGNCEAVREQLADVKAIHANAFAFAALRADGTVVTWGDNAYGGDSRAVHSQLHGVQHIVATGGAFAALRRDRTVVTWGSAEHGGDSSAAADLLVNVQQLCPSLRAFAALKGDGSVVTWGSAEYGGDSCAVQEQLHDIHRLDASMRAFAAARVDGSFVWWGNLAFGGTTNFMEHGYY